MDPADCLAGFICAALAGCFLGAGHYVLAAIFFSAFFGFGLEAIARMREQWGEGAEG